MAGNFAEQLKQSTLSTDKFVEETKKMIIDKSNRQITENISHIKENILKKSSLGEIEILNNKKAIKGSFVILRYEKYGDYNEYNIPYLDSDDILKIKNANLTSFADKELGIYCSLDFERGNIPIFNHEPIDAEINIVPSIWQLFKKEKDYICSFNLNVGLIHFISLLKEELKKENIILSSMTISIKRSTTDYHDIYLHIQKKEIPFDDIHKILTHNFKSEFNPPCGKTKTDRYEISINYYIYID